MACRPSYFHVLTRGRLALGSGALVQHVQVGAGVGRSIGRRALTDRASGPGGKFSNVRGLRNFVGTC